MRPCRTEPAVYPLQTGADYSLPCPAFFDVNGVIGCDTEDLKAALELIADRYFGSHCSIASFPKFWSVSFCSVVIVSFQASSRTIFSGSHLWSWKSCQRYHDNRLWRSRVARMVGAPQKSCGTCRGRKGTIRLKALHGGKNFATFFSFIFVRKFFTFFRRRKQRRIRCLCRATVLNWQSKILSTKQLTIATNKRKKRLMRRIYTASTSSCWSMLLNSKCAQKH